MWVIGLLIASIGALAGAFGDIMVRKVYIDEGALAKPNYFKNWLFLVGMLLTTVVDASCTVAALTFAPSAVVTPFAVVHIFFSIIIATFWLKEHMTRREYVGCFLLLSGVALVIVFSGKNLSVSTIDEFGSLAASTPAIVFFTVCGALILLSMACATNIVSKEIPRIGMQLQRFSIAAASGLLGGNTNLSAKVLTVAIAKLFDPVNPSYKDWRSYVVTLCTLILAVGQLIYLNVGLRNYKALYVIPTTNSCLVSSGVIGGLMFLKELPHNNFFISIILILVGLAIILSGIIILSWKDVGSSSSLYGTMAKPFDLDDASVSFASAENQGILEHPAPNLPSSLSSLYPNSIVLSPCAYMSIKSFQERLQSPFSTNSSHCPPTLTAPSQVLVGENCRQNGSTYSSREEFCAHFSVVDRSSERDTLEVFKDGQSATEESAEQLQHIPITSE